MYPLDGKSGPKKSGFKTARKDESLRYRTVEDQTARLEDGDALVGPESFIPVLRLLKGQVSTHLGVVPTVGTKV
jgi:hypothetical protein